MGKKVKTLKWEAVPLEGFPISISENFEGFVGLEECKDYGFEKDNKRTGQNKSSKKRKNTKSVIENIENQTVPKRVKLSNGFVVETCDPVTPSLTNKVNGGNVIDIEVESGTNVNENIENIQDRRITSTRQKTKLGDDITQVESNLTSEDMLSWAEFKLPEEIVKALTELGFKQPTKIQQLSLPAAIHGRRDILGAAETGSGKTLAFGLPILSGIMKLKEKAKTGLDAYDIPFKKPSVKKKQIQKNIPIINKKKKVIKSNKSNKLKKVKESTKYGCNSSDNHVDTKEDEYLEEYCVSIRKKELLTDEDNDSDDQNYTHLSEMLDSDDLVDTDNDEADTTIENLTVDVGNKNATNGATDRGLGCVKVIDDVEIPSHEVIKTGKPLYALILTPTRELAIQICRHLTAVAKYTGIRIATIVGGMAAVKQERVLRSGPEVVVATPGRLWELITQRQPHLQQLHSVKFLAIDETDRMIERGHFEELQPLLERLNADDAKRNTRQNFVFSATLTMVHDLPGHMKAKKVTKRGKIINRKIQKMTPHQKIQRLIQMIGMSDPKVVDITTQNLGTAESLTECRIACSLDQKDTYLYYILKRHPGRTIVFCNSIGSVRRLAQLFTILKCRPLPLHASMPQRQRLKNLERFRDDPHGVLVATDVAARGLDIPNVDHVIHYQVPRTAENYVHRSGRTARANKEGLTILMMEPSEAYLYSKICRTLNKTSELQSFPVSPLELVTLKQTVAAARDLDALMLRKRRYAQATGWKEKLASDMDMIIDDDELPVKEIDPRIDQAIRVKKRQLESLLSRPIFPKGFSFKYPTLNEPSALCLKEENALQVMKKAIESGDLIKQKRKSKNAPLLKLEEKNNK